VIFHISYNKKELGKLDGRKPDKVENSYVVVIQQVADRDSGQK